MTEDGTPRLRDATAEDASEVARIYGHYVARSCATFEEVAPSPDDMRWRLRHVSEAGLPWRLAEAEDGAVLGYAYAAPFRTRSAYRYTVENSVYGAHDRLARGLGTALMRDLIQACAALAIARWSRSSTTTPTEPRSACMRGSVFA